MRKPRTNREREAYTTFLWFLDTRRPEVRWDERMARIEAFWVLWDARESDALDNAAEDA